MDVIWIDAKKRLPSEEGPYLVVLFDEDSKESYITTGYYDTDELPLCKWVLNMFDDECVVTHWTHLPNLPEGVK